MLMEAAMRRCAGKNAVFYGRVSDPTGARDGRGLERQSEAMVWATQVLKMQIIKVYEDGGRSGFTGANRKRGWWKQYLAEVKADPHKYKGTAIVVEMFDRMSRERVVRVALPQFIKLIKAGITICTFLDGMIYDEEVLDSEFGPMLLQQSIMLMCMAHKASKISSDRRKNTNRTLREQKKLVGGFPPGKWLKRKKPGETPEKPWADCGNPEFWLHEERAAVVKLIFELYVEHRMGSRTVATELNHRGIPTFTNHFKRVFRTNVSGKWSGPSVRRILSSLSVKGDYLPGEWIEGAWNDDDEQASPTRKTDKADLQVGVLPILISEIQWMEAQTIIQSNHQTGESNGNRGRTFSNLFSNGVASCGHCGGSVYYAPKTSSKSHPDLVCGDYREHSRAGSNRHGCNHPLYYQYSALEKQVFAVIRFMAERQQETVQADDDPAMLALLEELHEKKDGLNEMELTLQSSGKSRPLLKRQATAFKADIRTLEQKIAARLPTSRLQAIIDLWSQSDTVEDNEQKKTLRRKLHAMIREVLAIKLYGAEKVAGQRPGERVAEIYWRRLEPGGAQLIFRWQLHHFNSIEPAVFDGVFVLDPETDEVNPLSEDEDLTIFKAVTAAICLGANPKLRAYREKVAREHIKAPLKVSAPTFEAAPCGKCGHTTCYMANGRCVECERQAKVRYKERLRKSQTPEQRARHKAHLREQGLENYHRRRKEALSQPDAEPQGDLSPGEP